jgi:hypothetical protein
MGKVKVMDYRIYIGEGCHDCERVLAWVKSENIEVSIVDADLPGNMEPPFTVFARPALFRGDELLAYGSDIINYFQKIDS